MTEERRRILSMLAEGKLTADEAEKLLDAVGGPEEDEPEAEPARKKPRAKYMHIVVGQTGEGEEQTNIRIPLGLVRAGMRLGSLVPGKAHAKVISALGCRGVTLDLKDLSKMADSIDDLDVDLQEGAEKVRIFCK